MSKELLFSVTKKDLVIETFRSGGKGGQHQNKTDSGVRVKHPESGAVGESREERSQHQNKKNAFRRMVNTKEFQLWLRRKTAEVMIGRRELECLVDEAMRPENLLIEEI